MGAILRAFFLLRKLEGGGLTLKLPDVFFINVPTNQAFFSKTFLQTRRIFQKSENLKNQKYVTIELLTKTFI